MSRKIKFRTVYRDVNGIRTDIPALKGRDGSGEGGVNYDDAQIKAQIAAVAGIASNPNILDNGWFTVNQRGQTSYTTENAYTVDRWRMLSLSNVVPTDKGLTLIRGQQSSNYTLQQALEYPEKYGGKTLTLSAMLDDGTIISTTGTCELNRGGYTLYTVDNAHNIALALQSTLAGALIVRVFVQSAGSALYLRAVKLEHGSVSTIANDFIPNYAVQLMRCMRFYQQYNYVSPNIILTLHAYSVTNAMGPFRFVTPMRTAPAGTISGAYRIFTDTGSAIPVTNVSLNSNGNTSMRIFVQSNYTVGQAVTLQANDAVKITFSADL